MVFRSRDFAHPILSLFLYISRIRRYVLTSFVLFTLFNSMYGCTNQEQKTEMGTDDLSSMSQDVNETQDVPEPNPSDTQDPSLNEPDDSNSDLLTDSVEQR